MTAVDVGLLFWWRYKNGSITPKDITMRRTRKCLYCGKEFSTQSAVKKYCCVECADAAKQEQKKRRERLLRDMEPMAELAGQDYLTFSKAAVLMGCSRQYVYKLVQQGKLPASRLSSRMAFVKRSDIERMMDASPYHRVLPGSNAKSEKKSQPQTKGRESNNANTIGEAPMEYYSGEEVMKLYKVNQSWLYTCAKRAGIPICRIAGRTYGCRSLVEIKLPNSIQCIGEYVFSSCESLEAIECDNVYYQAIDGVLFDRKEKRCLCYPKGKMGRKYTIPNGILIIGEAAFGNCCDLEEIILPESIRVLENKVFQDCSKLKSIKLPNQISSIASSAFNGCWDLKGIECDSPLFKSIDGVLFTADFKTLVCYPQGKGCDNYVVPDSVTNIAENAFSSFVSPWTADSCKRITLPKSINEITDTTFKHHESLKWIECDNEHYKSIDGVLFTADCKTLVYYPRRREDSQYIIPDTVTKIENRAFASNSYLRKIIVPKGRMEDFIKMFPEDNEYKLAEA